jgi:hypothetical protein
MYPQLTKPGQHDQTPVTTKHEKRLYANPLFAVSYGSFQGRPLNTQNPRYDLFLDLRGHQCRASIRMGATSAAMQTPTIRLVTNMVTSLYAECG